MENEEKNPPLEESNIDENVERATDGTADTVAEQNPDSNVNSPSGVEEAPESMRDNKKDEGNNNDQKENQPNNSTEKGDEQLKKPKVDGTLERIDFIKNGQIVKTHGEVLSLHSVFDTLNSTGDGFIDCEQLKAAFRMQGYKPSMSLIRELIWEVDDDLDGKISYEEFKKAYKNGIADGKGTGARRLFNIIQFYLASAAPINQPFSVRLKQLVSTMKNSRCFKAFSTQEIAKMFASTRSNITLWAYMKVIIEFKWIFVYASYHPHEALSQVYQKALLRLYDENKGQ
eukprot:Nk52_evm11s293 gene=Nk52_evmTU11s293